LAGQTPAPAAAPTVVAAPAPHAAPAYTGSYSSGCGCDTCDTGRHRLFGGGGGLFHRNSCGCDGGCNTCDSGHSRSWGHASSSCCGTTTTTYSACDTCGGHGGGFLSRCRGLFSRGHGSSCCDGGCGTLGCASGGCGVTGSSALPPPPAPAPKGEIINVPPKKMPAPPKVTPPAKTSLVPAPQGITVNPGATFAPPVIAPSPTNAPIIEVVPPTVPAVPNITTQPRSPF
jgi:hypothetical protein